MGENGKNPFTWDYDYKDLMEDGFIKGFDEARVRAAFTAAGKDRRDYPDPISKLLAFKYLAKEHNFDSGMEHEEEWPARMVLKKSLPEGWRFSSNKLCREGMDLQIRYDVMNSFATTFNFASRHLYPQRFGKGRETPSYQKTLAFFEEMRGWPRHWRRDLIELHRLFERFAALAHTIGNFTYIPYMKFDGGGTFNMRRGFGALPLGTEDARVHDYWDLSLEWLKERGIPGHWEGLAKGCPVTFEDYVELARLEFYCVDDDAIRVFLEKAEGAKPDGVEEAYEETVREKCNYEVVPLWKGHRLDDPGSYVPEDIAQIASFLEAVNLRIEARGRLLIALHEKAMS
ncbi:hypothetical protein [Arabiibacter massiliensis]|uniref:hypothetical protein n=1 Tax=Arabiibacter massiliensis TaxID=1870985 RepID=UPI00117B1A3B|nr:hypothetical protein [Arabiibacter massiliensis]